MRRCVGACGSYETARQKVHHEPSEDDGDRRALRARRARARAVSPRALLRCVLRARARLAARGRRHAHRHGSEAGRPLLSKCATSFAAAFLPGGGEDDPANVGAFDDIYQVAPWLEMAFDLGPVGARGDGARGGRYPPRRAARLQDPLAARCCAARRRPVRLRRARPRRDRALVARIPARKGAPPVAAPAAAKLAAFMRGGDDDATAGFGAGHALRRDALGVLPEMRASIRPCSCSNTRPSPIRPACGAAAAHRETPRRAPRRRRRGRRARSPPRRGRARRARDAMRAPLRALTSRGRTTSFSASAASPTCIVRARAARARGGGAVRRR